MVKLIKMIHKTDVQNCSEGVSVLVNVLDSGFIRVRIYEGEETRWNEFDLMSCNKSNTTTPT